VGHVDVSVGHVLEVFFTELTLLSQI